MVGITDTTNYSHMGKHCSKYETENGKTWSEGGESSLTKGNFLLVPGSVSQFAGTRVIQPTHERNLSLVLSARKPTKAFNGS